MTAVGVAKGRVTGPVVARAFSALAAFDAEHPQLSLSELARRTGLPISTVHRLAAELLACGALERGTSGRYQIGLRLWEIGALAPRGPGLREIALPFLEDLCEVTRENVQLAVREDDEVVYVERLAGSRAVPVRTRVGGRFALSATGVGLVLLAHAPGEVVDRVLASPVPRYTRHTLTSTAAIREALAAARRRDCAVSDRQVTDDAVSVAAPIRHGSGPVVAALSIVAHAEGAEVASLSALVRTSAHAVSRALGSVPGPRRFGG
ncbi:IclR family transcriptional regulator [Actinomycetospora corticicola]|uniref:Glycerol operon regulatory protein n=1 Tax=Actinomycetospora corticicola TaxID=663602 RepID=A0A7Y9DRL0_9PSEU|nr:DNA-binding IclR family transcriptional regulator [Actinomycetospora corticicola]